VRDADVIACAGIAIFESKKRHVSGSATAQPSRRRKPRVMFLKVRVFTNRRRRRLFRRHIVHSEFPFLNFLPL
jgi:hypothetical protein